MTKRNPLQAFRDEYDDRVVIPRAIDAGLKALGADYQPELAFIKRCGLSPIKFSAFREQYADFWVEVRKPGKSPTRMWCGTKEFAAECRKAANGTT